MTPAEIRAEYWKLSEKLNKLTPTADRSMGLAFMKVLVENTAQIAEMNELLKRTLGIVNVEKLALDLGRVVQEQEEQK